MIQEAERLLSRRIDGSGPIAVLREPSPDAYLVAFEPAGGRVLLRETKRLAVGLERTDLLRVALDGSEAPMLLAAAQVTGGDVDPDRAGFQLTPSGTRMVFRGDLLANGLNELFSVAVTGGPLVRVSGTLQANGGVQLPFTLLEGRQEVLYRADAVLDEDEPPLDPAAEAQLVQTLDGRGYLRGSFASEGHDIIATGLRLAGVDDPALTAAERRGQAMLDVFRHYLDHQDTKLGKRHRPHLNVVVREQDLANGLPGRTLHGTPLPGLVIRKIACDANIHRVITDGASSILDYGRATRTIPPAVYTSLVLRDLGCRFPGCDRPPEWCEGHHIRHWEDGAEVVYALRQGLPERRCPLRLPTPGSSSPTHC